MFSTLATLDFSGPPRGLRPAMLVPLPPQGFLPEPAGVTLLRASACRATSRRIALSSEGPDC